MDFKEDLLHYFWKSGWLKSRSIHSVSGEQIKIIHPGLHNLHSGPDFENAIIQIGETKWAGNVEMHLYASDWYHHRHEQDAAYDNVILHVVFEFDQSVFRADGTEIPVLELKKIIPKSLIQSYRQLMSSRTWIPCASSIQKVAECHQQSMLNRLMMERLEAKYDEIIELLASQKGSWDDAFYIYLARHFGFKVNALPFEQLAKSLPQKILAKHKNQALQIEALIFGQAGFLSTNFDDEYPLKLQWEYNFLRKKYNLTPLVSSSWKCMRLRPANFPTIRLAQFAALIIKSAHLFSKVLTIGHVNDLKMLFCDLPVSHYWETHYRFGISSPIHTVQLGKNSINHLLINVLVNFLFSFGKHHDQEIYRFRTIQMLEKLPAELNLIIRNFRQVGLKADHAFGSQALLRLKYEYCDQKKCLFCGIGSQILKRTNDSPHSDLL